MIYYATLFPDTHRTSGHLLATNQPYVLTGLVEEHFSTITVTVKTLRLLSTLTLLTAIEEVSA